MLEKELNKPVAMSTLADSCRVAGTDPGGLRTVGGIRRGPARRKRGRLFQDRASVAMLVAPGIWRATRTKSCLAQAYSIKDGIGAGLWPIGG